MNNTPVSSLFEPVQLPHTSLSGRIVMAPMTRCRATGHVPNDLMATYYAQRSSAGLIITEGTSPSPNGLGYARIPGIYSTEQTEAWKKITDAVHSNGGKIFLQMMHTGRIAHSANMPEASHILAPSAINADGDMWTDTQGMQKTEMPRAMTAEDIATTIEEYANAARNAIQAGFDGIELHGANGYLPEQFLNPHSNQRTDAYGGNMENRCRFTLEVLTAISQAIGAGRTAVRISPYSNYNSMPPYDDTAETYDYLTRELGKMGLAYLHIVEAALRKQGDEGTTLRQQIRDNFTGILILNGGYTGEKAAEAITNGKADMISFGSPFVSNPDLPYRIKHHIEWAQPDSKTFYTPGEKGYTDYPAYAGNGNS